MESGLEVFYAAGMASDGWIQEGPADVLKLPPVEILCLLRHSPVGTANVASSERVEKKTHSSGVIGDTITSPGRINMNQRKSETEACVGSSLERLESEPHKMLDRLCPCGIELQPFPAMLLIPIRVEVECHHVISCHHAGQERTAG